MIVPEAILLVSVNCANASVKQTLGAIKPGAGLGLIVISLDRTGLLQPLSLSTNNVTV